MGLFSSKKKTVVNADLSPLVDEKDRDTFGQRGLYKYIFDSKRSVSLYGRMMEEYKNSLPMRFEAAYRYASRGSYPLGLPRWGQAPNTQTRDNAVEAYIAKTVGVDKSSVNIKYITISEPNLQHYAWVKLQEQYGYNLNTNELEFLSTSIGHPVYLDSFQVTIGKVTQSEVVDDSYYDPLSLSAEWGYTPERQADRSRLGLPNILHPTEEMDFTNVQYIWEVVTTVMEERTRTEIQTVTTIDPETQEEVTEEVEVEVPYQEAVEVRTIHRDSLVLTYEDVIQYPAEEGQPVTIEGNYVQVMFNVMDEWQTLEYELYTQEDVLFEDALMGSGAEADFYPNLYARLDLENLHERGKTDPTFKALKGLGRSMQIDWVDWCENLIEQMEEPHKIRDALITAVCPMANDNKASAKYGFLFLKDLISTLTYNVYTGNWNTRPSTAERHAEIYKPDPITVADKVFTYTFKCKCVVKINHNGVKCPVGTYIAEKEPINDMAMRFALGKYDSYYFQDEDNHFIEYRLFLAVTTYTINSRQADERVFPLRRSLVRRHFSTNQRESLFQASSYVYIGTSVVIKTKWYQRGAFKAVMVIASIAFTAVTGGAGAALAVSWQAAIKVVAVAALKTIAVSLVMSLVAKILVAVGVQAEIITAVGVVVLLAAGYVAAGGKIGQLTALDLLQYANEALAISGKMITLQVEDIRKKMVDASLEFENKMEEINNLQDSIGLLSPEMLLEISSTFFTSRLGETPEEFQYRTLGMDVTELSLSQINNYVENMTRLPDFYALIQLLRRESNV